MSNAENNSVQPSQRPVGRLPAHDPAMLAQSIENARQFYTYDQQLSQQDRRNLASYFWQKTTLYPALGLPVLWGFIQSPNWLKRRGFIPANRNYRFAQLALGFVGLFAGLQFGMGIGTFVHLTQLRSSPAAQQAYALLSLYPPQLGSRYFAMTAKDPELALKDPDTIDWKSNPLFPFCLIMNRQIIDEWKRSDQGRIDRYRALEQQRKQEQMQRISSRNDENNIPEPTGTSWDHVIAKNRSQQQQQQQQQQPASAPGTSDSWGTTDQPIMKQSPPAKPRLNRTPSSAVSPQEVGTDGLIDGISVGDGDFTGNVDEDQKRFDELVERERQGTYVDDFTASEKKW